MFSINNKYISLHFPIQHSSYLIKLPKKDSFKKEYNVRKLAQLKNSN